MLEAVVEQTLISLVTKHGGMTYKFVVPGRRGYPDRLVKLPGISAFVVELKRPKKGVVAKLQALKHQEMRDMGWRVHLAKSPAEVEALLAAEIKHRGAEGGAGV